MDNPYIILKLPKDSKWVKVEAWTQNSVIFNLNSKSYHDYYPIGSYVANKKLNYYNVLLVRDNSHFTKKINDFEIVGLYNNKNVWRAVPTVKKGMNCFIISKNKPKRRNFRNYSGHVDEKFFKLLHADSIPKTDICFKNLFRYKNIIMFENLDPWYVRKCSRTGSNKNKRVENLILNKKPQLVYKSYWPLASFIVLVVLACVYTLSGIHF